jgi:drug/metabolite transporter (DMT)-like permease
MGDSSLTTWLSLVPLLVTIAAAAAAVIAWRSRRRVVRSVVAVLLILVGIAIILFPIGMLSSLAGGTVIVLLGVALLIVEYRPGSGA